MKQPIIIIQTETTLEDKISLGMIEPKILCPFCNASYTADMLLRLSEIGDCQTSDCGSRACTGEERHTRASLRIICDNCKKIVYEKEVDREDLTRDLI